jgi:Homeodomain-like domain
MPARRPHKRRCGGLARPSTEIAAVLCCCSCSLKPLVENLNVTLTRLFTVGLRGFRLNLSLATYIAGGPRVRSSRRTDRRQERRVSKRLPAETIERLVAEYRTGSTAADLSRRYGLAKTTVLGLIRQAGERVRHPRFSVDEAAHLVKLYEAGLPQKDIAAQLGRSPSAVWHCLRRLGRV